MKRLLVLVLLAASAFWLAIHLGAAKRDVDVVIPPGSSLSAAARTLEQAGAIRSRRAFLIETRPFAGRAPIKPGEYRIGKGMSAPAILRLLQSGKVVQRFIPVPEGMPSIMVWERLNAAPLLTGTIPVPAEGSILPDNYAYTRGEARAVVVARMQKAMRTTISRLWQTRRPSVAVTTPEAAINLAAIIEKETGVPGERRMVAAVYSNRLKRGMPLQADPTVIYPVTRGKPLGRRILRSELESSDAYNTYRHNGLPPGPITNPGRASIAAALDPAPSNALYFVATGHGGSVFADTLEQHSANVRKYYALRRARGEM